MHRPFFLAGIAALFAFTLLPSVAQDAIDLAKLRKLHQRAQQGEKLTPEEQAYYERGKAARKQGALPGAQPAPRKAAQGKKAPPADPPRTSTGLVPLTDLAADQKYKGEDGGLYGDGQNAPPAAHLKAALAAAAKVQPLDADGKPSPDGKIVFVTLGMSNTTQESQAFIALARSHTATHPRLVFVDGAQGGIDSRRWVAGTAGRDGVSPWDRLQQRIKAAGATPSQVQIVWMKHAIAGVGQYGEFPKHAQQLKDDQVQIARLLKERFPNLQLTYVSSRTYAGYATTQLNPEPYAYESAFATRWLIQDQIKGNESLSYASGKAPLLLWGPYLWSDGEKGRKVDGLTYHQSDYREDGTHPGPTGQKKIAEVMLKFFTTDPTATPWFPKPPATP
jgi:hypothetical protein